MTKKNGKSKVRKIDPQEPEARDEGPRLLPLEGIKRRHSFGPATELGDVALRKPVAPQIRSAVKRPRSQGER